jgi:hypothetical protein
MPFRVQVRKKRHISSIKRIFIPLQGATRGHIKFLGPADHQGDILAAESCIAAKGSF